MSFGLSSGGGQVRYALIVDDQATAKLNIFKNSLTQLGTATTQTSSKMAIMNNTFSAGVTPIKNTGNAMNQLVGTQKTLHSQLGSIGTAFKNNALAIGAAASSVLGLYQNYANLSSAQNNANKSATAAKAAQNNLTKAQDTLNKAIDKYGRGSKEAKAAQDKLTVAQERAVNKTESAKIAQDNLNQTMADFGINILPNVILAGGSIVSIFDNIGKSGSGVTGIISKLGGAFAGLGGGGLGISGLTDKLKSAIGPANGLKASLIGIGATAGVIGLVTAGALELAGAMNKVAAQFSRVQQPVSVIEAKFDSSGKSLKVFNMTLEETEAMARAGVSPIVVALDAAFGTHMTQKILENAGALDKNGKIILDFGKTVKTIPPIMNTAASSTDAWVNMMVRALKSADPNKIIEFNKAFKESGQSVERYQQILTEADTILGTFDKTIIQSTKSIKTSTVIVGELWKTWEIGGGKMAAIIAGFGAPIDTLKKKFLELHNAMKPGTFTQGLLNYRQAFNDSFVKNPTAITKSAEQWKAISDHTHRVAGYARDIVSSTTNIQPALAKAAEAAKKAAEQAAKFKDSLAAAQTNIKGVFKIDSNADKILKDLIKKLPNKAEKEIKLQLKFGQSVDDNKKAFNDLLFEATQVSDKTADASAKQIIETIDKKFKGAEGAFGGLRSALQAVIADPNTPEKLKELLMKFDWDKIGEPNGLEYGKSFAVSASKQATDLLKKALKNFNPSNYTADPNNTKKKGVFKSKDKSLFNITIPKPDTTEFDKGITAVQTSTTIAVTNISTSLAKVSTVKIPSVSETIYQKGLQLAINNAAQTVKLITSTLKKVSSIQVPSPNEKTYQKGLQLAINNAAQTVKFIKKELDKIGGIKVPAPKFNNFNSALDQAVSDAKRAVRDINNALTKVKKPSGGGSGPGATTGPFNSNTSSFSKSNSGSGDTVVNLNISGNEIVNEQKLTRRIKRSMGSDRYRFGLG